MMNELTEQFICRNNYSTFIACKLYMGIFQHNFSRHVKPGIRVEVQLKNKRYAGIIKKLITQKPEAFNPKPILNVLDDEPQLHEQQLKLWEWIADYYMCSEGEVMQAAMPANLKLSSETILVWNEEHGEDFTDLNDHEYIVAEALNIKKELNLSEVQQLLDASHVYPVIKKLIEKNVCHVWEELKEKYKEKKETYILLHPQYRDEEKLAELLNDFIKSAKANGIVVILSAFDKSRRRSNATIIIKKIKCKCCAIKRFAR